MTSSSQSAIDLIAVIAACSESEPRVMTIEGGRSLPSGPFETSQRSLQTGLRQWVERQTHHPLGYLEQLYTFADRDRSSDHEADRVISISYLGLTREERERNPPIGSSGGGTGGDWVSTTDDPEAGTEAVWQDWYGYFPWEDHRKGAPAMIEASIAPRLRAWAGAPEERPVREEREERIAITFGLSGHGWNDELVLQRYELLFEAGLVPETGSERGSGPSDRTAMPAGRAMNGDHRRILATGIARLRAKIKYRPVVFELMAPTFTLLQLQRCVEALAGLPVHKQNFRRLVEQQDLVEETGRTTRGTSGRPARLYRFRQTVMIERAIVGAKMPLVRA